MRPGKKRRESEAAQTNKKREQTRRPESRRETIAKIVLENHFGATNQGV